jgi:hypothetical protein
MHSPEQPILNDKVSRGATQVQLVTAAKGDSTTVAIHAVVSRARVTPRLMPVENDGVARFARVEQVHTADACLTLWYRDIGTNPKSK